MLRSDDANFINTFNTLYNSYSPVNKVEIEDTCRKKHVLSNSLKNACCKKNHLYRLFLRDTTEIPDAKRTKTN